MFKRLFWLTIGASFGFGLSFWLTRLVKQTMERYKPQRVSADLTMALRQFGQDLREAAAEGREAMREQEAALRADLAGGKIAVGGGSGYTNGWAGTHRPMPPATRQPGRTRRPDGTRQRPLRATGRLRIADPAESTEPGLPSGPPAPRQKARR